MRALAVAGAVSFPLACSSGVGSSQQCQSGSISDSEIDALCQQISALSCKYPHPVAPCVADLQSFRAKFGGGCCGAKAMALLECGVQNGLRCAELSDDVLFTPACAGEEESFDQCSGSSDNCSEVLPHPGQWLIECDQYSADCELQNGVQECSCTFGPHTGKTFQATIVNDEILPSVVAACK